MWGSHIKYLIPIFPNYLSIICCFFFKILDITVQFRRRMYMAFENENNFQVEVVASGNASFPYTFTVTVMDIEATQLVDYIFSTLPLTFEEGQLSAAFTLPIIDDNLVEGNETFKLSISVPQTSRDSGISEGEINMTLLLIKDNDGKSACYYAVHWSTVHTVCTYVQHGLIHV